MSESIGGQVAEVGGELTRLPLAPAKLIAIALRAFVVDSMDNANKKHHDEVSFCIHLRIAESDRLLTSATQAN